MHAQSMGSDCEGRTVSTSNDERALLKNVGSDCEASEAEKCRSNAMELVELVANVLEERVSTQNQNDWRIWRAKLLQLVTYELSPVPEDAPNGTNQTSKRR